jgi:hypothetical protein
MKNYTYLKDSAFLKEFDSQKVKEQYVKVTVLDFSEKPIQAIQGRVTGGSLNLDGNSSIRRTCNLSMVAADYENDLTNVNNLLSINKKVDLEIGFKNTMNQYTEYDILWFPLGIYVITSPSLSHDSNGVSISLQLKDKMCLLNGECGGTLPASTTFNEYETVDENGEYVITYPTVYQIIQELVNHFGGEQLSKIIISDVDTRIKKVMKWVGSSPLYIIEDADGGDIQYTPTTDASNLAGRAYKTYEYGSDVGYIYTDFYYPDELIGDAGASVCDILDKIKSTLGNYEYFYDLDGNFVFQEIKNYLNTSQSTVELENLSKDDYLIDMSKGKAVYTFDDSTLITSYSNTPQYSMIKNDFIVWGLKESESGVDLPIRYHLAIDQKPTVGNTYYVFFYEDPTDSLTKAKCPVQYPTKSDFPSVGVAETFYMALDTKEIYEWDSTNKEYNVIAVDLQEITTSDWRTELYLQGSSSEPFGSDSNYYYTELSGEWPKLYDIQNGKFFDEVLKYPSDIDFYLDFIDSSAAISEMSISNIGRRTKVLNDDSINCIFEPEIPDLVLLNTADENIADLRAECEAQGQDYIQLDSNLFSMITGGGNFNSAYNAVRELLYQYTSYNESISLTAVPIYYLEPNTRITVRDSQSGIYGDYMINTISIPLDISSTMTLSCTRALERI